ncbi:protein FAR1-RELATED SEQUENCE 5-like [Salvia hispanica]|uniref:protein FAR1-RELATED SEQUENCE 5-like n=1 Tax=Salvia hispanica TaxID=49212 RepID=UPI002009CCC4|nr:protein FAR1-RELATED SEQUENCE 5-like [Salvia hispanica]
MGDSIINFDLDVFLEVNCILTNLPHVLSFDPVACVPACPDELRPYVGKKFHSLDEGIAFYEGYGRETGFDVRKCGIKSTRDVVTWQYLVCNREGLKVGIEMDKMHAQEGFITKRRRTSKRCECRGRMSLKNVSEVGFVGLGEVHMRFIWGCTKANIGPTMTFKFLNEFLGGYDTVGLTVAELRNYVHGLKTYVEGSDAQMLLDETARKNKSYPDFTYHYQLGSSNELKSFFWCDAVSKRNYQLYGDVVSFDSTYNTNRYCMILSPFTGKDNHGKPVTFGAALLSNESTEFYSWLFKQFVESMGQAPMMIVTDQDRVPRRSLENEELKKEIITCVWSEVLEPADFEAALMGIMERYELLDVEWFVTMFDNRKMWVPAYFRDFVGKV